MAMSAKEDKVDDQTCLSLFTSNHGSHDSTWMVKGSGFKIVCIACLIEALEDKEVLAIRKRKILSEILVLLSRDDKMAALLSTNLRVCSHLCGILVNLLEMDNEAVSEMAIEGLVQLACKLRSEIIVREIVDNTEKKVSGINNLRKSCAYITLLGRLVNMIAPLGEEIAIRKSKLLEYCISNLLFPEEKSRLSLMYLVLGICQNNSAKSKLSTDNRNTIFKSVCESLANAKSRAIIMTCLALLQTFTNSEDVEVLGILDGDKEGQDGRGLLGKALKKVILDTDESIQIGGIQCTTKFLSFDSKECTLSRGLLQCGLAEFLFEGLETNNDVVLASLFCCLSGFCNSTEFFKGSYSVYGIDSVVAAMYKALKLQNPETIHQGLHVLSTIITKQSMGVPLFSNGATFERCLNGIQECFKSMEYKVLQEAIKVVGSLLRVDQLPSGFDIKGMLPSLSAVISLIKTFTTKNVDTFSGMKTDTAQELLCSSLAVIHKAITLVSEYREKSPSLEEALLADDSTYQSSQSNRERSIMEVNEFLMRAIDEVCIVAVMLNFEAITNPVVFEVLFSLINLQLSSPNDSHARLFAKKLSTASFIRISIDINGKFCKGGLQKPLMDALQHFQRKLILCLIDASDKEQMARILESVFIPASPDECLTLLSQSSMDPISNSISDKMLFNIQCFCIELLYFAYIHKDSILPEQLLLKGLHKYICIHRNLGLLPLITLKHLVFLYASMTVKLKAALSSREFNYLTESQNILEGTLLKLKADEFIKICSRDPRFVLWVFSSKALGKAFGSLTLENLLTDDDGQEQHQAILWDALKDNETALRSLLSLAFCENTQVVKKALGIIDKVLQQASQQEEPSFITQVTTEELQKLFLKNQVSSLPEQILLSMLNILLHLQAATGSQVEIKLLCFVIDILTKPTNKVSSITVAAINYLNVALSVNMDSQHPRVASVLFSNTDFISWLQKAMTSLSSQDPRKSNEEFANVFAACLLLVSNLVLSQSKLRIAHSPSVQLTIGKDVLIELLNDSQSCLLRLVCLVFWKAYFNSGGKTFVLFEDSISGEEEEESKNVGNDLTELDLKVIFVYLQNSLMHESEAVKGCSMECMNAFFSFEGCKDICKANRWNRVILESLLFSTGNGELNPHLIQMCTLMLKQSNLDHEKGVLSKAVQIIQHQIPKTHLDLNDTKLSKVAFSCVEFLNEVQVLNSRECPSSDELLTWCRNLQDLLRKTRKRKMVEFINVDQVVFTKACVIGQVTKDTLAKLISKVIRRLENNIPKH